MKNTWKKLVGLLFTIMTFAGLTAISVFATDTTSVARASFDATPLLLMVVLCIGVLTIFEVIGFRRRA